MEIWQFKIIRAYHALTRAGSIWFSFCLIFVHCIQDSPVIYLKICISV